MSAFFRRKMMALTAAPVVICFLSFFFYISETILLNRLIIHADDVLTESIIGEPVKPRTVPFQPRDFIHNPITNEEHRLLAQRYEAQYAHKNGTHPRIALCHPTIHKGDKQSWDALLNPIFAMISYYRLLGVSHIFAWYEPNVAEKAARWDELINTTSEFTTFVPLEDVDEDEHYHGQNIVMKHCIKNYAKDYDWILINDADEFFWWSKKGSLIDFVEAYSNYSYISLGKYMYSMIHQYQPLHEEWPVQNFGVEMHPFTPGSYCYQKNGTSMCPAFVGRCKLIIRPFEYQRGEVSIHGKPYRLKMSGTIHLDTSVAHWKEWCEMHSPPNRQNVTVHFDRSPFYVSSEEEIRTHIAMKSHPLNEKGQLRVFFDESLNDWMSFVAHGCPKPDESLALAT